MARRSVAECCELDKRADERRKERNGGGVWRGDKEDSRNKESGRERGREEVDEEDGRSQINKFKSVSTKLSRINTQRGKKNDQKNLNNIQPH